MPFSGVATQKEKPGVPTLRDLLKGPIEIPRSIEANLPAVAPKLSRVMTDITARLPSGPELPGGTAPRPGVTEFIKSIESSLPEVLPKISETTEASLRPIKDEIVS